MEKINYTRNEIAYNYLTNEDYKMMNTVGLNFKKNLVSDGFKLSDNMINTVVRKIEKLDDNKPEDRLKITQVNIIINSTLGKNRFGNKVGFNKDNPKHIEKLKYILSRESAFNGTLGKQLLDFFGIKPERIIIFEDNENTGRIIKEKTAYTNGCESFMYFIPVYNSKDQYVVDDDIKKYNKIANKDYDVINGRFVI